MELISRHHRVKGCPGLQDAAQTAATILEQLPGCDVQIHTYPSDGKKTYGTVRAPCNWTAENAHVSVDTPDGNTIHLLDTLRSPSDYSATPAQSPNPDPTR